MTLPDSDMGTDAELETQWLHCAMQNMFTLHRLRLESLLLYRTGNGIRVCTRICVHQCLQSVKDVVFHFVKK